MLLSFPAIGQKIMAGWLKLATVCLQCKNKHDSGVRYSLPFRVEQNNIFSYHEISRVMLGGKLGGQVLHFMTNFSHSVTNTAMKDMTASETA